MHFKDSPIPDFKNDPVDRQVKSKIGLGWK